MLMGYVMPSTLGRRKKQHLSPFFPRKFWVPEVSPQSFDSFSQSFFQYHYNKICLIVSAMFVLPCRINSARYCKLTKQTGDREEAGRATNFGEMETSLNAFKEALKQNDI